MEIHFTDYNEADRIISQECAQEWQELEDVLNTMPLHLKASDQAGKQGHPIFDPVGSNRYLRDELTKLEWLSGIPIPAEFNFLGTDVDFAKGATVVEVQFSNYPFLLNNTIRAELFFQAGLSFGSAPTKVNIIIAKARMFPASNSTLYYEQAANQLDALAKNAVFRSPIRLVGLFVEEDVPIQVTYSTYSAARYSRTAEHQEVRQCTLISGKTPTSRSHVKF